MYRKIEKYLADWKTSSYRKPLVVKGARQVGKTYTIGYAKPKIQMQKLIACSKLETMFIQLKLKPVKGEP